MRVLITGSSGFVAGYLIELLEKEGYDCYGFDINQKEKEGKFFRCDIRDKEKVKEIVSKIKPDYVIHLAAQSSVGISFKEPELTHQINIEGTRNLLDSLIKIRPKKIILVSSSDVYGDQDKTKYNENDGLKPISPYAESRVKQEKLTKNYQLNIIILRSFQHTGPGQSTTFVLGNFTKQVADIEKGATKPTINVGNLDVERDISDVRDIVNAYSLAMKKSSPGTYNVCSSKGYMLSDLLKLIINFSSKKITVIQSRELIRDVDIQKLIGDNTKFIKDTGWKPQYNIKKTLKEMFNYWMEH